MHKINLLQTLTCVSLLGHFRNKSLSKNLQNGYQTNIYGTEVEVQTHF